MLTRKALSEAQHAAARFEKASSAHEAAKEMVTLAEEGFAEKGGMEFDTAWQEMLNHATNRVRVMLAINVTVITSLSRYHSENIRFDQSILKKIYGKVLL